MIIRYKKRDGRTAEFVLEGNNITLGRSPDADIIVLDERASRLHAGIRLYEGEYFIKDLQSRNGTWVNGQRVENKQKISPGDRIRLGKFVCNVVASTISADDANRDIEHEMEEGKGFETIMREIVDEVSDDDAVEGHSLPVEAATDVASFAAEGVSIEEPAVEKKDLTSQVTLDIPDDDKPKPPPRPKLSPKKPSITKPKPKISLGSPAAKGADGADDKPKPPSKLKSSKPSGDKPSTIKLKSKKKPSIKLRPPKKKD